MKRGEIQIVNYRREFWAIKNNKLFSTRDIVVLYPFRPSRVQGFPEERTSRALITTTRVNSIRGHNGQSEAKHRIMPGLSDSSQSPGSRHLSGENGIIPGDPLTTRRRRRRRESSIRQSSSSFTAFDPICSRISFLSAIIYESIEGLSLSFRFPLSFQSLVSFRRWKGRVFPNNFPNEDFPLRGDAVHLFANFPLSSKEQGTIGNLNRYSYWCMKEEFSLKYFKILPIQCDFILLMFFHYLN